MNDDIAIPGTGNSYARQVILAMSLSASLVIAARGLQYVNEQNGKRLGNPLPSLGGIESFLAWGVILVVLVALSDIEATGALGASFAWLIFLSVLFVYGEPAFDNLRVMIGTNPSIIDAGDNPRRGEQKQVGRNPVAR